MADGHELRRTGSSTSMAAGRAGGGLVGRVGFVASAVTTVCCLGVAAAVSLATAVGATFLTRDATLKPLLVVSLAVTIAASAWTFSRHRGPGPLVLTVLASGLVFTALYGPLDTGIGVAHAATGHASAHPAMGDRMTAAAASQGGVSPRVLVWIGLAALLSAQIWDVRRTRRCVDPPDARHVPRRPDGDADA